MSQGHPHGTKRLSNLQSFLSLKDTVGLYSALWSEMHQKCREGVRTVVEGRENHNCSGFSECGGWWFVLNGRLRSSQVGNQTRAEASSRPWLVATASVSEYVRLPQFLVHSPLVLI